MSISSQILAFLLVLGPLILIHELGHFIGAKRGGIRVLEFGMGYPPRATRLWRGKGYVVVDGQRIVIPRNFVLPWDWSIYPDKRATLTYDEVGGQAVLRSIELDPAEEEALKNARAASSAKAHVQGQSVEVVTALVQQRSVTMRRGALQLSGVIDDLDAGTEYTLNWLPIGGFVRMYGEEGLSGKGSFNDRPKRWRAITLLAGPGMNVVAAFVLLFAAFAIGGPDPDGAPKVLISGIVADTPAAAAGLTAKDQILAIDNHPLDKADYLTQYVKTHGGQMVTLTILRNGQTLNVSVTPRTPGQTPTGQGQMGIALDYLMPVKPYPLDQAVSFSVNQITDSVTQIVLLPGRLISHQISAAEARPVGPVGISQLAVNSFQLSLDTGQPFWILSFMAMISMALAITNLLPLPALDGGRLVFVLIEAVRRKRISPEREAIVHLIGMALLLGLVILITIQDIINPIIN
jgi:regulator of sigma E protease